MTEIEAKRQQLEAQIAQLEQAKADALIQYGRIDGQLMLLRKQRAELQERSKETQTT